VAEQTAASRLAAQGAKLLEIQESWFSVVCYANEVFPMRSMLNMAYFTVICCLLSHFFPGTHLRAEDVVPLQIGATAPDFNLPGVDGRNHRLTDFNRAKVLAVIFTCNHCPTAQAYEDRIIRLSKEYKTKGVEVVAISPNDPLAVRLDELGYTDLGDSLEDMKIRAEDKSFPFPYLYDGRTQEVSRAYGVLATPHVFIFDGQRKLRYQGRFDDGEHEDQVKSRDALNAIDALLASKPVPVATTRVRGCSTKWADKRANARESVQKWDSEPVSLSPIDIGGIKDLAKNDSKKYRLVTVWATWCVACVAEFPEFVTMHRMYRRRNFELITITLDKTAAMDSAREVLKKNHMSCTNYIVDFDDHDALAEALDKDWPGPVPYTVLIAPGGKVIYRKSGPIEPLALKKAIVERLGRTY
jgi:peroxiredoxin